MYNSEAMGRRNDAVGAMQRPHTHVQASCPVKPAGPISIDGATPFPAESGDLISPTFERYKTELGHAPDRGAARHCQFPEIH
jgi:hypothetical protein